MIKSVLMLCLFISSQISFGQDATQAPEKPFIEIYGQAERTILPNEIYLAINIKERESGRDKITVQAQESQLKEGLLKLGIPATKLSVSNADADYIRVKWSKKDVISQTKYELVLSTAQQVADVFKLIDDLKIDYAYIDKVSHSEIIKFKKELRIEAIKAAKDKSNYLLEAIDQKTGAALIVKEITKSNNQDYEPISRGNRGFSNAVFIDGVQDQKLGKSEIQFKKIKLESRVYVMFQID